MEVTDEGIDYSKLTDDDIVNNYRELYTSYVIRQVNMHKHNPSITSEIANSRIFRDRYEYLGKAIAYHKNLLHELCIENKDGVTLIRLSTIMVNHEYVCDYIRRQIIVLSLFKSIVSGYVTGYENVCYNTYYYAMGNAKKLGLGFDKYKFLHCESGLFDDDITVLQAVSVLNTINKDIRELVLKHIAGRRTLGKLSSEQKQTLLQLVRNKDLVVRFSEYYNSHNPTVSYMNKEVGKFKLVE